MNDLRHVDGSPATVEEEAALLAVSSLLFDLVRFANEHPDGQPSRPILDRIDTLTRDELVAALFGAVMLLTELWKRGMLSPSGNTPSAGET